MGEVFLDALIDTLKVLPFLLVMNFLIELLEYKSNGLKANRVLKGSFAPLFGTVVGVVPQCGFSVVATELYGKRKIALGTLLAVYIATSDEALPIMLSSYEGVTKVLPVLLIKIIFALVVGYAVFGVEKIIDRRKRVPVAFGDNKAEKSGAGETEAHASNEELATKDIDIREHEHADGHDEHEHEHEEHNHDGEVHIHGCHHHCLDGDEPLPENADKKQKAKRVWNLYLKHPLLHTATVILFIFIVNVAFGIAVYFLGEDNLAAFIGRTGYFQPLLAAVVGLIPNCAASVVITELYVVGGLSLGGAVSGLCVSAGIGYAVLVKQNRPVKNTVLVIALMFALSVALGTVVNAIPFFGKF